jgi:hypothetical protein
MYFLITWLDTPYAEIVYAADAPDYGDACDEYDSEAEAVQAMREWQEEREG